MDYKYYKVYSSAVPFFKNIFLLCFSQFGGYCHIPQIWIIPVETSVCVCVDSFFFCPLENKHFFIVCTYRKYLIPFIPFLCVVLSTSGLTAQFHCCSTDSALLNLRHLTSLIYNYQSSNPHHPLWTLQKKWYWLVISCFVHISNNVTYTCQIYKTTLFFS